MPPESNSPEPIRCAHLLRAVDEKLIDLLSSLTVDDWERQTGAPSWRVRDVAAHLLDTTLRKLSMARDCCYVETVNTRSTQDVITLVNRLNREGVTVYRRLSPRVLIDMMKDACEQSADFHESLDPFAPCFASPSLVRPVYLLKRHLRITRTIVNLKGCYAPCI